jgi:hypothetical protein
MLWLARLPRRSVERRRVTCHATLMQFNFRAAIAGSADPGAVTAAALLKILILPSDLRSQPAQTKIFSYRNRRLGRNAAGVEC